MVPSESVKGVCSTSLLSLPTVRWQSLALRGLWKHRPNLCLHEHMAFSQGVCVQSSSFFFLIRTSVIWGQEPTLLQCDPISDNYICNALFQIRSPSEVLEVRTLVYDWGGGAVLPITEMIHKKEGQLTHMVREQHPRNVPQNVPEESERDTAPFRPHSQCPQLSQGGNIFQPTRLSCGSDEVL